MGWILRVLHIEPAIGALNRMHIDSPSPTGPFIVHPQREAATLKTLHLHKYSIPHRVIKNRDGIAATVRIKRVQSEIQLGEASERTTRDQQTDTDHP